MTDEEWEAVKPYAEAVEAAAMSLRVWEQQNSPTSTRARLESSLEGARLANILQIKSDELREKMRELEICLH